ncbi:hypothetical protein L7F22_056668 [Adiantum nelumboides]|nr:hypothetical protein [Adiantum nelumboides]
MESFKSFHHEQFLARDAKDKVLTKWQSLKLSPYESIHKYGDLHLKAVVYKRMDFEEQKQRLCAGLREILSGNEGVNEPKGRIILETLLKATLATTKVIEHDALIFFDPGSTDNFISIESANKLGIQEFEMGDDMKVDGAFIGQDLSITPLFGKLRLHIQGYVDKKDFFISPLKHEDVILGAPWSDFLANSIKFFQRKISFKLKEKDKQSPSIHSNDIIDYKNTSLLHRFVSRRGKILSRRMNRLTSKQQRLVATAIKKSPNFGLNARRGGPAMMGEKDGTHGVLKQWETLLQGERPVVALGAVWGAALQLMAALGCPSPKPSSVPPSPCSLPLRLLSSTRVVHGLGKAPASCPGSTRLLWSAAIARG